MGRARAEIDRAVEGIGAETLRRAAGNAWSIAQILEHLTLAFTVSARSLEKALASGELRARRPLLKQRLARILVVEFGYFPRVAAPEATVPTGSIAPECAVSAIRRAIDQLDVTLTRAAQRFGERALVANHPYFAGLTVQQWRKFHWRHTRHHMRQVRQRRA